MLITGASGYLGQHLLHSILNSSNDQEELEVIAISCTKAAELQDALAQHASQFPEVYTDTKAHAPRAEARWQCQLGSVKAKVQPLDFTDERQVERFLRERNFDVCIHAGAMSSPRLCHDYPEQARAANVPRKFLRALHQAGCRIIALSTDQVYGGRHPPYQETDPVEPLNVYAQTKVELESFLLSMAPSGEPSESTAASPVLLRSSIILGPLPPFRPAIAHDTFLHFCQSRKDRPTAFYVDERRSVVDVRDVVSAIRWLVRHAEVRGVFNLGGPCGVSRYDMAWAVFEHLHFNTECVVAEEKPSISSDECVVSPLDITMNINKLRALSGISFTPLKDIVARTFPH
jgi:dTDP-4-dehydrorhamnose reductase